MTGAEETIPKNTDGTEINVEESVACSSPEEAQRFFALVKERLLNVNRWKDWAGALSANFQLTNENGQEIDTFPRPGNYFKIAIPAPGIVSGEGYDWVRIEEVKEDTEDDCEYVAIRVRPASSPVNEREDVAHFYTDEATSNFIAQRRGTTVTAGVYGRNEKPNVQTETLIDKVRNAVVGTTAATAFSKLQWKALVSGLLDKSNEGANP